MKLMFAMLTHHRIDLLDRCVKTYFMADQVKQMEVEPVIVVNTLDEYYYEEVVERYRDVLTIVKTESNGRPGKGKNSVFEVFQQSDCDYLFQLDGDNFLYPTAFVSAYKHISRFTDIDVLALAPCDRADPWNHEAGHMFFVCGYEATVWNTSRVATHGDSGPGRGSWVDAEWPSSPNTLMLYSQKGASYRMDEEQGNGEDFLHSLKLLREHQLGNINFYVSYASDWFFHDGTVIGSVEKEYSWADWIPIFRQKAEKIINVNDSSFNELPTLYLPLLFSSAQKEEWVKNNF